ncbi:hypothetical protein BO225_01120 [Dubosiella newyorkensis]|jgi:hypothetical protein|uniref:Uncharacterized protein n=4 Tax=Dubosiella newyorkensis TaxID=1862672 RepID=A0A1U7NQD7_9FIRM|nr:hypothetical protein BO225_01120 [Dubosiella newyorkensis]
MQTQRTRQWFLSFLFCILGFVVFVNHAPHLLKVPDLRQILLYCSSGMLIGEKVLRSYSLFGIGMLLMIASIAPEAMEVSICLAYGLGISIVYQTIWPFHIPPFQIKSFKDQGLICLVQTIWIVSLFLILDSFLAGCGSLLIGGLFIYFFSGARNEIAWTQLFLTFVLFGRSFWAIIIALYLWNLWTYKEDNL